MKTTIIHILIGLICFVSQVKAQIFPFRYLPPIIIAPTEEASCMFFDKEGMMWEVEDELGNKGWVSSTMIELSK